MRSKKAIFDLISIAIYIMSDFTPLFDYVEKLSGKVLSADEKQVFMMHFKSKKLKKRQYFLQEGDICKYTGFIVKGSARTFTVDKKGHEHILKLSVENWWLNDFESFYQLTPSRFNIQALEDMEFANNDIHVLFPGEFPIIGKNEVISFFGKQNVRISSENVGTDRAFGGEYAYTYGKATITRTGKTEDFNYIRIWQRSEEHNWNVLFELFSPLTTARKDSQ